MKTQLSTAIVLALSFNLASAVTTSTTTESVDTLPPPPHCHHAPPFAKLLERFDVNQDGSLTHDEVQSVQEGFFKTADTDVDGFLTAEELEAAHVQEREAHVAEKFAELDSNNDGGIQADELTNTDGPDRHLARHFAEVDSNGDGSITLAEMKASMQAKGAEMDDRHEQMKAQKFTQLDTDSDGKISLAEFLADLPMFNDLDVNEDGLITADEAATKQPPVRGPGGGPGAHGKKH
ncbi:MAG: hypothetical protein BWK79_00250 [Beggiatoa sp. IS2]|nr:MAG: hypothetical protein BWK79_00250 [Beggiatoa sp. IS2]